MGRVSIGCKTDSIVSSTNNTLTATAKDRYRRYTGSAGLTTINENIHSAGDEHYGEVEGGERTFNAGSGVIIRVAEGFLPIVKSGGKYSLKFKSSTDVYYQEIWSKKIEASPNSATDPGATYSQVESQAILDELRDLKLNDFLRDIRQLIIKSTQYQGFLTVILTLFLNSINDNCKL